MAGSEHILVSVQHNSDRCSYPACRILVSKSISIARRTYLLAATAKADERKKLRDSLPPKPPPKEMNTHPLTHKHVYKIILTDSFDTNHDSIGRHS